MVPPLFVVTLASTPSLDRLFSRTPPPLSGVAEVALGLGLLWPASRPWAAWGIVALLIAVFPANLQMFQDADKWTDMPRWGLAVRLPIQGLLIYWAWTLTRG